MSTTATRQKDTLDVKIKDGGVVMKTELPVRRNDIFHSKWFIFFFLVAMTSAIAGVCNFFGIDLLSHPILAFIGSLILGFIVVLFFQHKDS